MAGMIMMALVGAVAGFFIKHFLSFRLTEKQAIVLGVVGSIIGVAVARLVTPALAVLIPAVIGAAVVLWAVERYRNRVL
jgi:uncharacterized membrane protein YeaQ/YmgE (transglycosylase-associated protein family)